MARQWGGHWGTVPQGEGGAQTPNPAPCVLMQSTREHRGPLENTAWTWAEVHFSSCPSAFIHSRIHSFLFHPFKTRYWSQAGISLHASGTQESYYLPGGNHRARTIQADMLKAQRAFPAGEIHQAGHQPRVGLETPPVLVIVCDPYHRKLSCCWILGHLSPLELMPMRSGSAHCSCFKNVVLRNVYERISGRRLRREPIRSQLLAGGCGKGQHQAKADTAPLQPHNKLLLMPPAPQPKKLWVICWETCTHQ